MGPSSRKNDRDHSKNDWKKQTRTAIRDENACNKCLGKGYTTAPHSTVIGIGVKNKCSACGGTGNP